MKFHLSSPKNDYRKTINGRTTQKIIPKEVISHVECLPLVNMNVQYDSHSSHQQNSFAICMCDAERQKNVQDTRNTIHMQATHMQRVSERDGLRGASKRERGSEKH